VIRFISIFAVLSALVLSGLRAGAEDIPLSPLQALASQTKNMLEEPAAATNRPAWKSSLTIGFAMTSGNKDTLLVTGKFRTERKSPFNEWLIGANGAYGEANSVKTYETAHGFVQLNHFFTDQLYGYLRGDALHDGIKDIQFRCTASTGVGYYLLKETNMIFSVETGPAYVAQQQGDTDEDYAAWRFAERFEYKLNSHARFWHSAEIIPELEQTDNFIVNAEIGIETAIAKELSLQVYLQDNYVNLPAPSYKHNDVRIVSGLSYKF
jgi:putative salt-induced outer membrane protein YdiY